MTDNSSPRQERLEELLAGRVLGDLSPSEEAELARMIDSEGALAEAFERVGAACDLAFLSEVEPMPEDVRAHILDRGRRLVAAAQNAAPRGPRRLDAPEAPPAPRSLHTFGWWAAAAGFLLAAAAWWPRVDSSIPPRPEAMWAALERRPDLLDLAWSPGPDDRGAHVRGRVRWSNDGQEGVMRFAGLPANDPAVSQYQLWIFDRTQDANTPVDGGVFDVTGDGEVLIPIDAKLGVVEPYLFAVTIEKRGGVPVSDKQRIAATAAVGG